MYSEDHEKEMRRLDREHGRIGIHMITARTVLLFCKAAFYLLLGIAAVTFSARANAADIAMMPNQAGGEIVLTNAQVPSCPDLYLLAYSRGWDGTMITGCWIVGERHVLIRWTETQTVKLFLITQFTVIGQEPEARPAAREFRL